MGHRAQLLPAACHKRPQTHGENSGFLDLMILGCRGGLPQVSPGLSSGISGASLARGHPGGLRPQWVARQHRSHQDSCAGRCFSGQSTTKESPGLP